MVHEDLLTSRYFRRLKKPSRYYYCHQRLFRADSPMSVVFAGNPIKAASSAPDTSAGPRRVGGTLDATVVGDVPTTDAILLHPAEK
jgi:hypothetical protein